MSELVFGKYEIQHRIAIGGMGEVFYAMQRGVSGFERPVILKSLLPDLAQQQDLVNQFLDEARVAATLNHPNVVSIFEVGLWNGTFYIAMEYIRGRNLSQLIRRALEHQVRIPPIVSARIIREAAMGLDHAHVAHDSTGKRLNIVHRDISPQNIMLREDGVAKVVDFGIASASNRSTRTATGTLKGKLAYMAPEQILAQPMTPLVDEFALGIVFWEMLTCRRLFRAESDVQLIKTVLEAPIPRPEEFANDIPKPIADVAMRMLNRDPLARYGSLGEVADALESVVVTPTPQMSPGAFMRRLGTDDLRVAVKPATPGGENFVISLNDARATPSAPHSADLVSAISIQTGTIGGVAPKPLPPPAPQTSKRGLVIGGVLAALAVAGGVGFMVTRPDAKPVVVDVPRTVVTDRAVTPVEVDAGPAVAVVVPVDGTLELKTQPPGAQLRVDGRLVGTSPRKLKLSPQTVHYLAVELSGYERLEKEVTLGDGEEKPLLLTLKARPVGKKNPQVVVQPTVTAPEKAAEPGFITINTIPWSKVTFDGEYFGSTPLPKRKVSPGSHRLEFVNEEANINTSRTITILPGENQKLQLKLP